MAAKKRTTHFSFPIIRKVEIKHFSLYTKADFLEIDLSKNVFCLAGANGLGKSTFITIINYGLTGIVKNPQRRFTWYNEIPKFYNQSKSFAAIYFEGRVNEEDYERAEVTIEFSIGEIEYSITRGFFEPDELRGFTKKANGKPVEIPANTSFSDLNDLYKTHFVKDVKLSQFDQFVFLQSYLLTFDETHQLLFWDESLIERVLYLFFGVDADKAKQADRLRKEYNKYDSEVRNLQWQITRTRSELESVTKKMQSVDINNVQNIELFETHKSLLELSEELTERLNIKANGIKDVDLNISDLSLKASSLRSEYETIFSQSLREDTPIERNPTVVQILRDLKLRIYANKNYNDLIDNLVGEIKIRQKSSTGKSNAEYFTQLQNIDKQLTKASSDIKAFQTKKDRFIQEEKELTIQLNEIGAKIDTIEKENSDLLKSIHKMRNDSTVNDIVASYNDQIARYAAEKDEAYRRRNKARKELDALEKELNQGYTNAESEFIPIFNSYAKSFLGLDITIGISSSIKGATLQLNIQDSKRDKLYQLSESQRYFIDIALRMALVDLSTTSATLLIDTPEGSLDIAYESRAGKMLGDFANKQHKIIMTANINSSQLLTQLAKECTGTRMQLERMTTWTTMSEVQIKESKRIEEAYSKIQNLLV